MRQWLQKIRLPRWFLRFERLHPLLRALYRLRVAMAPRPVHQAQSLWNAGRRDQAIALLRDLLMRGTGSASAAGDIEAWQLLGQFERDRGKPGQPDREGAGTGHGISPPLVPTADDAAGRYRDLLAHLERQPPVDELTEDNVRLAVAHAWLDEQVQLQVAMDNWIKYEFTKYQMRNTSLFMRRHDAPAPGAASVARVPDAALPGFTMNGRLVVEPGYLSAARNERYRDVFTDHDIDQFARFWRRERIGDNLTQRSFTPALGLTDKALRTAVARHVPTGQTVAVLSRHGPAYEALCLVSGVAPTTFRHEEVENRSKRLDALTIAQWRQSPRNFDAAIAIHVVEHEGLGQSGRALEPDGDLALMRLLQQAVKPNGLLFLVVPVGGDGLVFNTARIYGAARLPLLLKGWQTVETSGAIDAMTSGLGDQRPLFVLRNVS